MDAARWERVRGVLEDALEQPAGERGAFIARACGEDPSLRGEVESLLAAHQEAEMFLEPGAAAQDAAPMPAEVGRYRLLRLIGQGGMGTVYLAERADGAFRRQVALKLLKRGLDFEEFVRRFRAEREILAALDHPGIARLLDGGSAPDGRPYLVMEYVPGEPIDAFCRNRSLRTAEILRLFLKVCEAVSYAHRSLVVHRDLKAQNLLVTAQGQPKLLDFGIAKLVAGTEEDGPTRGLTALGLAPLTPDYASPEQVRGEPVTTASDVYSLGVLLYELVAGQRPYRLGGRAPEEVARLVSTVEPEPPSRVVARRDEPAGPRPFRRRLAFRRRRLPADLDHIVLMALRKEPERRYPGAEKLGEDIQRFLSGHPVQARPEAFGYRAGKFLRRHRLGVAIGASALVGLVATLLGLATQRAQVLAERQRAEATSEFLVDLFEVSDPARSRGESITAREVLDLGARRISLELAEHPQLRADLELTLGRVYAKLGLAAPAERLFANALATLDADGVVDPGRRARILHGLGQASALEGDFAAARRWFEQALDLERRLPDRWLPDQVETLTELGEVLIEMGEPAAGEPLLRQAIALGERAGPAGQEGLGRAYGTLGTLLREAARYEESQAAYERALAAFGDQTPSPAVATLLLGYGTLQYRRGDAERAEALLRRALAMQRQLYPEGHPDLREAINDLGMVLHSRGRYREAERLHREALALATAFHGEDHAVLGVHLINLAATLVDLGDLDAAEALYRRAIDACRRLNPHHLGVGVGLNNLARVFQERGQHQRAVETFSQAIAVHEANFGGVHPEVLSTVRNRALSLLALGRFAEAEADLDRALTIARGSVGERHLLAGLVHSSRGELELERGNPAAAAPHLDQALEVLRAAARGSPSRHVARTLEAKTRLALEQGRVEEALAAAREVVAVYEELHPDGHLRSTRARLLLARCLLAAGNDREARALREAACLTPEAKLPWAVDVLRACGPGEMPPA